MQKIGSGPVWWGFSSPSVSVGASPSPDADWLRTGGGFSEPEGEGGLSLSLHLSFASSGPTRRKTLSHLFEIVRPGLSCQMKNQGGLSQETYTTERPIHPDEHDGSGCRQLLAQIEVVPGLSCPSHAA